MVPPGYLQVQQQGQHQQRLEQAVTVGLTMPIERQNSQALLASVPPPIVSRKVAIRHSGHQRLGPKRKRSPEGVTCLVQIRQLSAAIHPRNLLQGAACLEKRNIYEAVYLVHLLATTHPPKLL